MYQISAKHQSQRQLSIAAAIQQVISTAVVNGEVYHPMLEKLILSFPMAQITADLRIATIAVSTINSEQEDVIIAILQALTPTLRKLVAKHLKLRYTPELRFVWDNAISQAVVINKLLTNIVNKK